MRMSGGIFVRKLELTAVNIYWYSHGVTVGGRVGGSVSAQHNAEVLRVPWQFSARKRPSGRFLSWVEVFQRGKEYLSTYFIEFRILFVVLRHNICGTRNNLSMWGCDRLRNHYCCL